jgi:hypothetical protein
MQAFCNVTKVMLMAKNFWYGTLYSNLLQKLQRLTAKGLFLVN